MKEIWKPIKGYENRYSVSNFGNVKNNKSGRTVTPYLTEKGYVRVRLSNEDGIKNVRVHRLVADAFIPNPLKKDQVNHIDGDKTNNCSGNLEWVTCKENIHHAFNTGLINDSNHVFLYPSLPVYRLNEDGTKTTYKSIRDAERQCGINHERIRSWVRGKRTKNIESTRWFVNAN